jgi:hypothetical protein
VFEILNRGRRVMPSSATVKPLQLPGLASWISTFAVTCLHLFTSDTSSVSATTGPDSVLCAAPQEQPFTDVEMPGQHSTGEDPSPDGVVLLVGIGADVPVVSSSETSQDSGLNYS